MERHNGSLTAAASLGKLKMARKIAGEQEKRSSTFVAAGATALSEQGLVSGAQNNNIIEDGTSSSLQRKVPIKSGDTNFDRTLKNGFRMLISEARSKERLKRKCTAVTSDKANSVATPANDIGGTSEVKDLHVQLPLHTLDDVVSFKSGVPGYTYVLSTITKGNRENYHDVAEAAHITTSTVGSSSTNDPPSRPFKQLHVTSSAQLHLTQFICNSSPTQRNAAGDMMDNASSSSKKTPSTTVEGRTPPITGPWECPKCTYVNTFRTWSNATCEMCEIGKRSGVPSRKGGTNGADCVVEVDC